MPRQSEAKRQIDRVVGKNVSALMLKKGLEPKDVARELVMTSDSVNKILRGDRGLNVAQLVHLSNLFQVGLEQIAYENGVRPRIIPFLRAAGKG